MVEVKLPVVPASTVDSLKMGDTKNDTVYSYESNMSDGEDLVKAKYSMVVVSMVFFSITFVLGIPGNALVIWIAGVKLKKTVNTICYVNLAVADLLCCLAIPIVMSVILTEGHWPYGGEAMCKLLYAVYNLNMYASVFTLTMISLDRFTLVIWPVWAQNHRSISRVLLLCALAWFLALILSLPDLIYNFVKEGNNTRVCVNVIDRPVTTVLNTTRVVFGFLVPLLVMTVCYLLITRRVSVGRFKSQKALRIMVGVVTAFFVCWLLNHTVYLVIMYKRSSINVALAVAPLAISLACFNSCLNPVLYVFMGQDFKDMVKVSLCRAFENAFREDGMPREDGALSEDGAHRRAVSGEGLALTVLGAATNSKV